MRTFSLLVGAGLLCGASSARFPSDAVASAPRRQAAEVTVAPLFSNGMVLQRNAHAPLWGRGEPGSRVEVVASWGDEPWKAQVSAEGAWRVELDTPEAGGPYRIVVRGDVELVIDDVLVGEVWLCSGQSNMEWRVGAGPLGGVFDGPKEIAAADHPRIRQFDVPNVLALSEAATCGGAWSVCSPKTVGEFSAVAYFFARELERELDVPIGIVNSTWSGTPICGWMDGEGVRAARPAEGPSEDGAEKRRVYAPLADALARVDKLRGQGAALSAEQRSGRGPQVGPHDPSLMFNAMVAPLAPYALRGFLWYQGESDRERAAIYADLQRELIRSWRRRFDAPDAPFYFVQIAPFHYPSDRGETGALREAQRQVVRDVPNTGMAVTLDVGDPNDIHPRNKQDVGKRLARWALAMTYGKADVVPSGPVVREVQPLEGGKLRLAFEYAQGGLISAADHLEGFELVDASGAVCDARAEIDGESVVVWHPKAPNPVRVRYGYGAAMQPVLFNKTWLPAAAFSLPAGKH